MSGRAMRSCSVLVALVAACRAPAPVAPPVPAPAPVTPAAPPVAAPAALPGTVGGIERPEALAGYFEALAALEAKRGDGDVRVAVLGDSHIAADWETGPLRRLLQQRFGDGGRGFVPLGRPWKVWSQEGVLTGTSGAWLTRMHKHGEGPFGLTGFALESREAGSRAWTHVLTASTAGELAYLEQPGGGSFDLLVDNVRSARITTRADAAHSAFHAFPLAGTSTKHLLEVRPVGDGNVRIFGVALDRADTTGLVLDALGLNGSRVATALSWSEDAWTEDLRHRAPALVIVAYGTNDAVDYETPVEAFEKSFVEELARIGRIVPSSSCLVVGPPDRTNAPRLAAIVAAERRAAASGHCAYFDRITAMGGPGSILRWGQPDRVHLSREGYSRIAASLVGDLLAAYELWKR